MKRRMLSVILTLALCLSMLPTAVLADERIPEDHSAAADAGTLLAGSGQADGFAGGDGTPDSPYLIGTVGQLEALAAKVNGGENCAGVYFLLTQDIDLSSVYSVRTGASWTPIGDNYSTSFAGVFDGGGHWITGVYAYAYDGNGPMPGLFGHVASGGVVQNLSASVEVIITYGATAGGLAAINYGRVENCRVTGSVFSTSNIVGGVVGSNSGTIEKCVNEAVVDGGSGARAGGIAGANSGTVKGCYNSGNISATGTGDTDVGGIVGLQIRDYYRIENCYNTGAVSGGYYTGGILGGSDGIIINCYSTGTVSSLRNAGGILGRNDSTQVTNCYYLDTGAGYGIGSSSSNSGAARTTANDFRFLAWKLGEGWANCGATGRPILADNPEADPGGSPIEITSLAELNALRDYVNGGSSCEGETYLLTVDIDMGNAAWTPFSSFSGTFDGGGHLISGFNGIPGTDQGLFQSVTSEGVVKNLGVKGTFSGYLCTIGGIAAHNSGTIENCYSSGTIASTYSTVGGVVGRNSGVIKNCYHTGSVTNNGECAGGIAGINDGTVEDCYNAGTVSGGADMANGYPGQNKCGGIVGKNRSSGTVKNCYNAGEVTSSGGETGGITGAKDEAGTVENCYYSDDEGKNFRSSDGQGDAISAGELAGVLNTDGGWAYSPELERPVLMENLEGLAVVGVSYYIPTLAALEWVRNYINGGGAGTGKYFYLTADIDLSGTYNKTGGKSWTPIGTESRQFTGTFDGAGHRITGLYLNSNGQFQGLFGYVGSSGRIQNLGVASGSVTAYYRVGGIAGINYGTIENCYNAASVTATHGTDGDVGGIAGNNQGLITNCYNIGDIKGTRFVGGIAGYQDSSRITNCYNFGTVTGSSDTGGIVGRVGGSSKGITNCYYLAGSETGDAGQGAGKTAAQFASGEVAWLLQNGQAAQVWGQAIGSDDFPVLDSSARKVLKVTFATLNNKNYAVEYGNPGGTVTLPADPAGAEEGYAFAGWRVGSESGAVFTGEVTGTTDLTVVAVQQEFYGGETGGDSFTMIFGSEPVTRDLDAYLSYIFKGQEPAQGNFTYAFAAGGNTAGAMISGSTLIIPGNASLGSHTLTIVATEWAPQVKPLALDYGTEPVTLTLSVQVSLPGGGTETNPWLIESADALRAVANYITWNNDCAGQYFLLTRDIDLGGAKSPWTRSISSFAGVFDGGDHRIDGLYIGGNSYISGLFSANSGTVQNLTVAGEVTGSGSMEMEAGGIVCSNSGTVENCHSEVNITIDRYGHMEYIGGVVGRNSGTVEGCSYSGVLSGDARYVGGIVGRNSGGTVLNCCNTGSVSGSASSSYYYTGGIVGENYNGTVQNCYNAGTVTGSGTVGNIAGRNDNGAIENCYYESGDGQIPGIGNDGNGDADVSEVDESRRASGSIAWALQNPDKVNPDYAPQDGQVWGQTVGSGRPGLTADIAKRVVLVTFATSADDAYAAAYGNPGGTVDMPEDPPSDSVYPDYAVGWRIGVSDGPAFNGTVTETEDFTVIAVWQKMYGGETDPSELALTTTYGVTVTMDLDDLMGYADGGGAAGNFTYELTDNGGLQSARIQGSTLIIPDTAPANEEGYILTVTAVERVPDIMPFSIGGFGIQDVTLTLRVVVNKAAQAAPDENTAVTVTKTSDSITATAPVGDEYEFSLDGRNWQAGRRFDGLEAGTEYTVWVRFMGDGNHKPSDAVTKTVTTANADGSADVLPGETLETEKGSVTNSGDSVTLEDGQGNTTTVTPAPSGGAKVDKDGKVTAPGGSAVTPPGGPEITVNDDAEVDESGNVAFPEGGSAEVGGTTVTVPEGGTLQPDGNGSVIVPGGSTVTDANGRTSTVPSQGGKLDGNGAYTANPADDPDDPDDPGVSGGGFVGTYVVTVSQTEHGKVTVSQTSAASGRTVTIRAIPDEGYGLSRLTVTDSWGNELTLTDKGDGTYTFIMPGRAVTVTAMFALTAPKECDGGPDCPSNSFADLDTGAWYHEGVDYVISRGLMSGYGNGRFGPGDTFTRAMLTVILFQLEGGVPVNYLMQYDDIPADKWYTEAIRWATSEGIVSGYGNGRFGPNDPVTREQLATMLYRYEQRGGGFTGDRMTDLNFTDAADISDWAYEAICWCSMNDIIGGKGNGIFDPKGKATRAEAATLLMRFLEFGK